MHHYTQKKDYKISRDTIDTILDKLKKTSFETIHYIGWADKDLIVALKEKYKVSIADYYDRTNFSLRFWSEGNKEDGFTLDGTPINMPPTLDLDWMDGVQVTIEGAQLMSEHDVLILDIPLNWKIYSEDHYNTPQIVFLLNDADSSTIHGSYTWSYEDIWIGRDENLQKEKDLFEEKISKAHEIINEAEAIIITAGAGMGIDSGLPDFRGIEGFWKAYPLIAKLGYDFTQMANPALFTYNPKLAWGFYGHRLNLYCSTVPHEGFEILLDLVAQIENKNNYFILTSNVDGQFQKAGFDEDRIYEVHGSIHHLQCSKTCTESIWENHIDDLEINMDKLEAEILPRCKNCKELARPNILMFSDNKFIDNRAAEQNTRFYNWKLKNKGKKIAIIEIGAGSIIPTVRNFGDRLSNSENNVSLIRINPKEDEVYNDGDIGIKLGGLEGIKRVYYGNY